MDTVRSVNFKWPADDVVVIRTAHLEARRLYRQPAPAALNLTLSAFTEMAFQIGRRRSVDWWSDAYEPSEPREILRDQLSLTWTLETIAQLEDDWEDLSHQVLRTGNSTSPGRRRIWKSDVARLAVLTGLSAWENWVAACRNDARRPGPDGQA
ncbi:hypothetical protein IEZ26_06720 [Nocardioides cavernae]|uniref:Uncharacterized protein n=1 Tax=Nocardioides cavernae TaxID=1921566 RepID=A0ABR8N831_9ACTN|nr:hypothetical protein [Nocardioides cavernae]MBD3924309.1 hypothetical protein [Nocardioides cavernae]MBM7510749.1 hypothetical protein [Nocardioides cavernae]